MDHHAQAAQDMHGAYFVGWQGKIPSVGDFASRGLADDFQRTVHTWLSQGMQGLSLKYPDEWRQAYLLAPVWHFVIPAGVWHARALQGCLAPSLDKVGRLSPLLMVRSFDSRCLDEVLPPATDWPYRVDARLRQAIGQGLAVEAVLKDLEVPFSPKSSPHHAHAAQHILKDLGIAQESAQALAQGEGQKHWFSWPDLNRLFADRVDRSFWWAEPSPKQPPRQIIHSGSPDAELFILLMGGTLFDA